MSEAFYAAYRRVVTMNEKAKKTKAKGLPGLRAPRVCKHCGDANNTLCRRHADATGEDVCDCSGACPSCGGEACGASRFQRLIRGRPSQCAKAGGK